MRIRIQFRRAVIGAILVLVGATAHAQPAVYVTEEIHNDHVTYRYRVDSNLDGEFLGFEVGCERRGLEGPEGQLDGGCDCQALENPEGFSELEAAAEAEAAEAGEAESELIGFTMPRSSYTAPPGWIGTVILQDHSRFRSIHFTVGDAGERVVGPLSFEFSVNVCAPDAAYLYGGWLLIYDRGWATTGDLIPEDRQRTRSE
jgi:hypothetical protein